MSDIDARIPVTVLTGFLGSGKTTLLNRILTTQHGRRIAVIENEFGEIGIDHELVVNADEEVFEMNNGCICCTVRGDLLRILGNLMKRRDRFDYILIETTGLADPGPVAQTFLVDEDMRASFRLDGIVTLVDAKHVVQHLDSSSECQEQIAFADRIILNKTDLVTAAELDAVEERLRAMNRMASVLRAHRAAVPVDAVLEIRAFSLDTKLQVDPDFLTEELPFEWEGVYRWDAGAYELVLQEGPDPSMQVLITGVPPGEEADPGVLRKRAVRLFSEPERGVDAGGELVPADRPWVLRLAPSGASGYRVKVPASGMYALFTEHGPEEFGMALRRDGVAVDPERSESHAAGHEHDAAVTSVGLSDPRALDAGRLNEWLSGLLRDKGADIFRMKGILHLKGSARRFVFQGVHMLFDGVPDRPWQSGETRASQMVFIGRNLNRAELQRGFQSCIA